MFPRVSILWVQSEPVRNAGGYSRFPDGRFTVAVERYGDGRFRIEVLDHGGRWIEQEKEGHDHLGLVIVSRLASAWGIHGDGLDGRTVWFELRPVQTPSPSAA